MKLLGVCGRIRKGSILLRGDSYYIVKEVREVEVKRVIPSMMCDREVSDHAILIGSKEPVVVKELQYLLGSLYGPKLENHYNEKQLRDSVVVGWASSDYVTKCSGGQINKNGFNQCEPVLFNKPLCDFILSFFSDDEWDADFYVSMINKYYQSL